MSNTNNFVVVYCVLHSSLDDKTCLANDSEADKHHCNADSLACATSCAGRWVENIACPVADASALQLSGTTRRIQVNIMDKINVLCMLWRVHADGRRQPVAKSYEGHAWEASAVPAFGYLQFDCDNTAQTCQAELPAIKDGGYYEIMSLERPALPLRDEMARFWEQTTFGPRPVDFEDRRLRAFSSFAHWIRHQQVDVPLTSHRRFVRRRLNNRAVAPSPMGVPTHPCQAGTRYRRYAFSDKDALRMLQIETNSAGNQKILSIDGQIRTILPAEQLYAGRPNLGIIFEDRS